MTSAGPLTVPADDSKRDRVPLLVWVLLAAVLAATALLRVQVIDIPLERDEGEYAYIGQMMLRGVPPYEAAHTMKFPGTAAMYALSIAAFGETTLGVRIGFMIVNAATIVLIFVLARRMFNSWAGLAAAASYAALSTNAGVLGHAGHATHYVVLPVVAGLIALISGAERRSIPLVFASGVCFGLATLMKHPGAFYGLFAFLWLAATMRPSRAGGLGKTCSLLAALVVGGAAPLLLTGALIWWQGTFESFWFWTVTYARYYGSELSVAEAVELALIAVADLFRHNWPLLLIAAFGIGWLVIEQQHRRWIGFFTGLFACCVCAVSLGWIFRPHYFVLFLPMMSLLAGAGAVGLVNAARTAGLVSGRAVSVMSMLILIGAIYPTYVDRAIVFAPTPEHASRLIYLYNPFPECEVIAEYLRSHSDPDARIAVLGSEPQICFLAGRTSATPYLYMYGLMEPHPHALQMQVETIRQIESVRPEFIVFVEVHASWLGRPTSHRRITDWIRDYATRHYRVRGVVELLPDRTDYYWDADVAGFKPMSDTRLLVLERVDMN